MQRKFLAAVWISLFTSLPSAIAQTSNTVQTGYIRLVPDAGSSAPAGVAIFGLQAGGVLVTEAGVPASTMIQSGRIFADVGGPVNTGIALVNPGNQDVTISFYFTDGSGRDFGAGSYTLPAKNQRAAFLNERPFNLTLSSLTGTFTFTSSGPIAAIALRSFVNERNEVLVTTLPVSPVGNPFGGKALLIPHFADGDGWAAEIVLVNPEESVLTGTVQFFGQGSKMGKAQPVKVAIDGVTSNTFSYSIERRSVVRMKTQRGRNNMELGSIEITPAPNSDAPSSLAIFSYENNGKTVTSATVSAQPPAKAQRMYIESVGSFGRVGSLQTGLSISNPSSGRITVRLEVLNLDGTSAGLTGSVDIAGGGNIAKFANELFPKLPSPFKGVLRINAPSPVAVVGLRGRYNERGELLLTTTPPYDEASPPANEISFPHFLSGGGYSTQLVLLSTGVRHSGSLWLLSQDGVPLPSSSLNPAP